MEIYILSSGRANRQPTWDSLPQDLKQKTKLVIPAREQEAYHAYPTINDPGTPMVGAVRQWISEQAKDNFIMLDDDLTFAVRRTDDKTKFRPATPEDVRTALYTIEKNLAGSTGQMNIAMREGANRNTDPMLKCVRAARVYAYNLSVLKKVGVRFDRCYCMDDFDVCLQLIRAGYPNMVLNWIVQNQYGSNSAGGASQWRVAATQELAANKLKELHPDFVKVVIKKTKTAWGWGERTDVIVQWKKAFESAGVQHGAR